MPQILHAPALEIPEVYISGIISVKMSGQWDPLLCEVDLTYSTEMLNRSSNVRL